MRTHPKLALAETSGGGVPSRRPPMKTASIRRGVFALTLAIALGAGCATTPPRLPAPPAAPDPVALAAAKAAEAVRAAALAQAAEIAKHDPAQPLPDGLYAEIGTPRGVITVELFFEKMPLTVASFVGLAEGALGPTPRKPFYDGLIFHRVVPDFAIQGGDPTGTGRGDPGYKFPDEFAAGLRHDGPGVLSMANGGPDSNGSQFFITLGASRYLDFNHAIFGRVIRHPEVPAQIVRGDPMTVKIVRRGADALAFRTDEAAFNARLAAAPRKAPPHLEDLSGVGADAPPPWQAKYLENRLGNLERFTGRKIYVRLLDAASVEVPATTVAQAAAALATQLHLAPGAILVCYFANEDQWIVIGGPADLKLPASAGPNPPPDNAGRTRQGHLYAVAGEVVSAVIDQTDPK